MNGFDAVENAISNYLSINWNPALATLVLTNQESPDGNQQPHIKLTVQGADAKNLSLGTKAYRYKGVIFVQVFTEVGTGSGVSNEIATALTTLFRDVLIGNVIRCKVPNFEHIGVRESWFQSNFSVDFSREEY